MVVTYLHQISSFSEEEEEHLVIVLTFISPSYVYSDKPVWGLRSLLWWVPPTTISWYSQMLGWQDIHSDFQLPICLHKAGYSGGDISCPRPLCHGFWDLGISLYRLGSSQFPHREGWRNVVPGRNFHVLGAHHHWRIGGCENFEGSNQIMKILLW